MVLMEHELAFPTFDCLLSNTKEDFDSEVENFFLQRNYLMIEISKLRVTDREWAENYEKMMNYLTELSSSILYKKDPPSYQFLIDLSLGEEIEDKLYDRLMRSRNPLVADLAALSTKVREVMYWYVRNGKNELFKDAFNPARFQGLPFLRLVLIYRSISLSGKPGQE